MLPSISTAQGPPVGAACHLEGPVFRRRTIQGQPEADDAGWVRSEEGGILVAGHGIAKAGLLEDHHGLDQSRVGAAEAGHQGGDVGMTKGLVEDGVEIVKRVSELVDPPRSL